MEVKLGYKQTEAGMVPMDWLDHTVGDLIEFEGGSQPDRTVFMSAWKPGYVRLIQIRDYKTNRFETYIPTHLARRFCTEEDIMIGRYGPPIFQILCGLAGAYNVALIKAKPRPPLQRTYAYYFLKQDSLFAFIEKLSQRSSGQTGVDLKELRSYPLSLPPTRGEQEAIAEALRDGDALIESLEQLIAKKCHLKQGATQELLLPKPTDEVRPLREVSSLKGRIGWQGLKQTEFTTNEDEPFLITGMNFKDGAIRWSEVYHISESRYEMATDIQLRTGDVLMTKDGTIGKVLYIDSIPYPGRASLNSHLLLFRPIRESYNPRYLYYQLGSQRFTAFVELSKSGTTFFGLSQAAVGKYPVLLPPIEEQRRIADILSDMDEEIAALEAKLAKARHVKQGMMQELLTGRIRLA